MCYMIPSELNFYFDNLILIFNDFFLTMNYIMKTITGVRHTGTNVGRSKFQGR